MRAMKLCRFVDRWWLRVASAIYLVLALNRLLTG